MNEKEDALQHLSEIKSVLVDKESFFPYNYNALVVWGVIGMVLTMVMPWLMKSFILYGTIFSTLMITVGFVIEGFLTKQVNENYDIETCTKKQRFIGTTFTVMSLFAIFLSALLAKYDLIIALFPVWIFACALGDFVVGFVLNIRLFSFVSYLSITVSLGMLAVSYFVEDLGDLNSGVFYLFQGATFALLGLLPIMIGRKLAKDA